MATSSPPPNTPPLAISPTSAPTPPQPSSPPPQSSTNTNATSPQSPPPTNSISPLSSPSTKATSPQSPPPTNSISPLSSPRTKATSPQSPPPTNSISPLSSPSTKATPPQSIPSTSAKSPLSPPISESSPPPSIPVTSPPPATLAPTSPPPTPTTFSPPPPSVLVASPPNTSPPPPPPPSSSPPPPTPPTSPPPASPSPPSSPSPSSPPPTNSPPPSTAGPLASPPPPPKSPSPTPPVASPLPPKNLPPPPSSDPSESPSPPPTTTPTPPQISAPPPAVTPKISPPPPSQSPPPPGTPKVSPSPPSQAPPSPTFSPPPPSHVQVSPPPSNPTTNSTSGNAPEISSSGGNGGLGTGGVLAIGLVLGLVLLSVVGIAVCFVRRRKKRNSHSNGDYVLPTSRVSTPQSDSGLLKAEAAASRYVSASGSELVNSPSKRGVLGHSRTWFTYEELVQATDGFSQQNLLGEGGFGSVYKGCLPNGEEVAVKQLKIGGGQGEREFKAEVEIISRIHHRHLVSLAGYCIWESRRLLVYEYVPNNNLHFHLHGEGRPVMEWATRVKIAAGAARGIAYLHEDCHPRVIHRDIKSSNILLDNNFEARVSDFGLAKLALDANTHITTRVVGTFGYMAPEYASSGKLTEKSDVYSFGVVLLELITGRKPVDTSQPVGDESLVAWARQLLNQALETDELEGLADPKLDKNYVNSEMLQMVEVAAACVRHSAVKRPRMGQVVRAFESMVAPDITNGVPVGDSEIYNTPPQSSEIQWIRRIAFGNQDFSTGFFSRNSSMNGSRSFADEV